MKENISAKIIADSINDYNVRLVTMQLKYPRFIHSEFMTHRVFSRNASSSRAIPVNKMLEQIMFHPARPEYWGVNQSGMQAYSELDNPEKENCSMLWNETARFVSHQSEKMQDNQLHKQIANRITEPFQHINVIVTSTEWANFFALRDHKAAQPEIRILAKRMKAAKDASTPKHLGPDEWHLPYVREGEFDLSTEEGINIAKKCSAARCARVSYLNHDKSEPTVEADVELFNMLVTRPFTDKRGNVFTDDDPIHASPTEHQAKPLNWDGDFKDWELGMTHLDSDMCPWSGNFMYWTQYRQLL